MVNVKEGTITVSPGARSRSIPDSSRADVQEVVSNTSAARVSLLHELPHLPGEVTVGGLLPTGQRRPHVVELGGHKRRHVELELGVHVISSSRAAVGSRLPGQVSAEQLGERGVRLREVLPEALP